MSTQQCVWLPHEDLAWTPSTIVSNTGSYTTYRTHTGSEITVQNNHLDPSTLDTASQSSRDGLTSNLVNLDEMGEAPVIHALRTRYERDAIYTNIGPILVSINPYKLLPIYSSSTIALYPPSSAATISSSSAPPPHVFQIAASAYHQLMTNHEDQAVIISGESGAGKTEATKTVLSYLSEITQRRGGAGNEDGYDSSSNTQQQILLSNPILESFGNSKTLRNNNSSRFGKYMQINISLKTGGIVSARIFNYLLEKSRVTKLTENERNYHIFYQMLTGLTQQQKSTYGLSNLKDYYYLSQSNCLQIDGVNDAQSWQITMDAMQQLQFSETEINSIIAILAAILQLGNLRFKEIRQNNMDATECISVDILHKCATNLKLSVNDLSTALRFRSVTIRGETSMIPLNLTDTIDSRDALAKALYDRLFNWIVERLNKTLYKESDSISVDGRIKSIGILDIFGFEIFEKNLFEQFCINYANEKLQQHFNSHIFSMEMALYAEEGIDAKSVDFCDNIGCVELIEAKAGIIKMLEEETMLPQGSDKSLIEKMHNKYALDRKAGKNRYYEIIKKSPNIFVIKHYAGEVHYDSEGMLAKSKDKLHDLLETNIRKSEQEIIVEMWDILEKNEMLRQREILALQAEAEDRNGTKQFNTRTMNMTMGRKKVSSLGTQFSQQLQLLMATLNACQPHFIRCIKPNLLKNMDRFDSKLVLTQLSYAGLFEAIKVRKSGFAYRKPYGDFLKEYRILCSVSDLTVMAKKTNEKDRVGYLLSEMLGSKLDKSEWQLGETKVFMRNNQRVILGQLKDEALTVKTILLQSAFRGCLARRKVKRLRDFYRECSATLSAQDIRARRDKLRSLLDTAQQRQYQLVICKQLRTTLDYLSDEDHTLSLLRQALQPPPSLPLLQSAIDSLASLQPKLPSYIPPLPQLQQDRAQVQRVMERVIAVEQRKKRMRERRVEEDWEGVRAALSELEAMGEAEDAEVKSVRAALTAWEEEENNWKSLNSAINSGDVERIEISVEAVRRLPLDDTRSAQLTQARNALLAGYSQQLDSAVQARDGETIVRKKLMPKLEQLQFVDLVYRAQGWLDEQDKLRVMERKRRQSSIAGGTEVAAQSAPVAPVTEEEDEVTKAHNAEKQRRLEQMNRIDAMQKRRSILTPDDIPPPPPSDNDSDLPPPPPPPEFDTSLEEFFPPPPPSAYSDRDAALTAAMSSKDYTRLQQLVSECHAAGHSGRLVRMGENVMKQWGEEEKMREMIRKVREDGWDDDDRMKDIVKRAGLIGMSDDADVKELRHIVYTMTAMERMEMRMQWARDRDNIPLLLLLLSQASDEGMESERIDNIRAELNRSGVASSDWAPKAARAVKAEQGRDETQQERYRRYMETYSPAPLTLSSYPFLRRDKNYAKHSILYKERVMALMLRHQKEDIPTSLLFLSTAHCGSKKESQRVKQLAKQCFKNIKGYMCDTYHPYPVSLGYEVVMVGVNEQTMRDEIFCQLIKQTTENKNHASLLLGLKLMYLALSTFQPSAALSPFILSHLANFALRSVPADGVGFGGVDEMATNCWLVWEAGEKERESRQREIQDRRSRGEVIEAARIAEMERARMKLPSMQDIERLTTGTRSTSHDDADDMTSPQPSTPSPRSATAFNAPKSPLARAGQFSATLTLSASNIVTAGPPSPRSGGANKVFLSTAPISARKVSGAGDGSETSFNYAPMSPGRPVVEEDVSDVDSLMAKGFTRENVEEALKLKGSKAEALSFLIAPTFAPPPTNVVRSLSFSPTTHGFQTASGAPIPPPPIFSKANTKPQQPSTNSVTSSSLSPRSAPPPHHAGAMASFSASVPSSPAAPLPSTPPLVPMLLSLTRRTPPSLHGTASQGGAAPAVPFGAVIAPAPAAPLAPSSPFAAAALPTVPPPPAITPSSPHAAGGGPDALHAAIRAGKQMRKN